MAYSPAEDAMAHHAANTAAVVVPVASVLLHLPEVLTCMVSFMGIMWYGILMFDWATKRIAQRRQMKQSAGRVRDKITEMPHAHTIDDPAPPTD